MIRKNQSQNRFRTAVKIYRKKLPDDFFAPVCPKLQELCQVQSIWSKPHGSVFRDNSNSLQFTFRRACSEEKKKKRTEESDKENVNLGYLKNRLLPSLRSKVTEKPIRLTKLPAMAIKFCFPQYIQLEN